MARKSILLAAMLVMILVAAGSALAQGESVVASGVIEKPEATAHQYGTHAITDEASGTRYALQSNVEWLLDGYVGQRVVHGTIVSGYEAGQVEGGPALLDVYRVETADLTVSSCADPRGCEGTGERDRIFGTAGDDAIYGYEGDDVIYGMEDRDDLRGGAGNDVLYGDTGRDKLYGGKGDDVIHADDGSRDRIFCGSGTDTVIADTNDRVAPNCEKVTGPDELGGGVLATFGVDGERFRAWVTNPETIEDLYRLQRGESAANIINGRIFKEPGQGGHNAPYSWRLDPEDVSMAEATAEVCDARPSYVEENVDYYIDNVKHYCPWGAKLVDLRNYTGADLAPTLPAP